MDIFWAELSRRWKLKAAPLTTLGPQLLLAKPLSSLEEERAGQPVLIPHLLRKEGLEVLWPPLHIPLSGGLGAVEGSSM